MTPFPRGLLATARSQHGLITASQLVRAGVSARARSTALAAGQLVTVHRGVYRFTTHDVSFEQRCAAALLAAPHAVLSGPTAGRIWELRKTHTDDVHIISRASVALEGAHAHKTDLLGPDDSTERNGLRVLAPGRLFCDLAWHLDDAALESVLEQMLQRRLLSIPAIRAQARRFRRKGRPGSRRLGRTLDGRPEWLRPAESDLELRLWHGLAERGVITERQIRLQLDSGAFVRFDLAIPALRYAIEVDHVTWHGGRLETQTDKRRDREVARLGWLVSRVTDDDLANRRSATIDQLIAVLDERSRMAA